MFNTNIKSVFELTQIFATEQDCIDYLEIMKWSKVPISPFDATSKVYKCKNNQYRCKNTGKYFNVKTGTLFENSKISLRKWFMAIWLVTSHKKGISSIQLGKDIGVRQATAWFMLQRIRACFGIENGNELEGVVECDETFIGGKNKNRHKDKKVKNSQGRSFKDKVPVMGILQRDGKMNAFVVPDTKRSSIQPLICRYVNPETTILISDEWLGYTGLNKYYDHKIIDHSKKEYVSLQDNSIHTNNIEGSWNILKKSVSGMYNHVSKKHLQKYVDEFVYRFNLRKVSDQEKFRYLLSNSNIRTKYKELCQ
ncbi:MULTISPECIES: IS1595 family transposase [Chryseobacterium]|uniref:Transposase-like protein n=1 Tax=Chryseobacterium camelliae TaxID=1265445 RepID=A0ABU0TDP8_9FLAO|nr:MULTISPECIES: IS1595 family transposase [Chryseobacterium]MDT3407019.1 transposase-like protein [Pseudacidovorax intermedius]MDQ1095190.1 transposase-like protein [Chryseobacterium camelliae]MDQ1099127.1 transposase-like protein [Chryseobacterium sp. SORGH_AS_1048]MDR6086476.1 transposase-like protein [Chryseobacterium sp. SORGH_AS_0909]MDR6130848.1 transposase-like protein [Chryseobacterium sp. SORGH_AS_1175]